MIFGDEAACYVDAGMPASTASTTGRHDASVFLYAFDLIELNGDDLHRDPLEVRRGYAALLYGRAIR